MNAIEKMAFNNIISRLNNFIDKIAAKTNTEKKKIVIVYYNNELYYQLPNQKPILINLTEL